MPPGITSQYTVHKVGICSPCTNSSPNGYSQSLATQCNGRKFRVIWVKTERARACQSTCRGCTYQSIRELLGQQLHLGQGCSNPPRGTNPTLPWHEVLKLNRIGSAKFGKTGCSLSYGNVTVRVNYLFPYIDVSRDLLACLEVLYSTGYIPHGFGHPLANQWLWTFCNFN